MGLRLVPRSIDALKAGVRLAKYHAIDKARLEREAAEREQRRQRDQAEQDERERLRREEQVRHEQDRTYARVVGEQRALIEMREEARQLEYAHESRMVELRERSEDIARQGAERRDAEREKWIGAIAAVADRFGG